MNQETYNSRSESLDEVISLKELYQIIWLGKWIIVSITSFISIIALIYSLLLPNIYESKATLAASNPSSSISGALNNYSSLAGLAGVSFPYGTSNDNSAKALKKISSLSFFENNLLSNIYLPDLIAVSSWNSETNKLEYDKNIFDTNTNLWVGEFSNEGKRRSAQKSYRVFKSRHLTLEEDKKTRFITLSIKHQSPYVAQQWAELVVNEINNFYRQKDKKESEKAASYLKQQILITSLSEVKEALAQLLQEETKKLSLIEANQFYVFEYIDPPAVMEIKSEPSRALICILGAILGGLLSILLVFVRHYFFNRKIL